MYDFSGSYGTDSWGITFGTGNGGYSMPPGTYNGSGYGLPGYTLPGYTFPGSGMSEQTKQMLMLAGVVLVAFLLMRR